ncbi:PREDICTED: uncharacterized protein LOC109586827 [Amphimedon queenslandica]|uniref:Death domain-containing protein n=1 Tax=Amphimedon queenslandica TaxID=400682 RepID=A0AAN0JP81_AMPQE|nr:PREDICTED: uncharacterized protein LOC109586827 [Amphimedon queenslandica]|eukprot:XP_019858605.1 PREDICTED: uncharacterized protein LOC109586827 [Amphimedon queenslandica]
MASKLSSPVASSVPEDPPNQLTITDLPEILQLLRRHDYTGFRAGVSYCRLGRYLGLSLATLDVITENHNFIGDIEGGLHACLTKWLQKADDVQYIKGGSTLYSLVSALRRIGEYGVADGIDMEKHPACRILARYISYQSIVSAIPHLDHLCLYQAKLIKEVNLFTYSEGEKVLDEIKEAVCKDYKKLKAFADILCKSTATAEIGRAIMRHYRKVYTSDDDCGLKIYLPWSITSEFKMMQIKMGDIFFKVGLIMTSHPQSPSLDNIKGVLGTYYSALRLRLAECKDIHELLELVHDNSSLDDISGLEYFIHKFNINEEAKVFIKDYKEAVEQLKRKVQQFLEEKLSKVSSVLECVTIVVDKDSSYSVLHDVVRLSSAVLSLHFKLNVIRGDGDGGIWKVWKEKPCTDSFDAPTVQSKDTMFATEIPAGTTESMSHSYQEEEKDKYDKDQVMLLQKKVKNIQKQLEKEKELHEQEKQFHEQFIKEYEEEILQQKRERIQNEETIAILTRQREEVTGDLKHKTEQCRELISDNELTHKQLEELLKEEKQASSISFMKQNKVDLKEKEELQIKVDDLQQELVVQHMKDHRKVSELQNEIQKIKDERETFQKQRKVLILENERLKSFLKEQNVPVQPKEEYKILQDTETVHACTYISKDDISQLSVILEPVKEYCKFELVLIKVEFLVSYFL